MQLHILKASTEGAFETAFASSPNYKPEWPLRVEAVEKRVCRGRRADLNSQVVAGSAR
jgi:hypothetical protein